MVHRIVAGGGGAFLHPTHGTSSKTDNILVNRVPFHLAAEFPSREISRKLAFRNLLFPYYNWRFASAEGVSHLLLWWFLQNTPSREAPSASFAFGDGEGGFHSFALSLLQQPWPLLLFVGLFAAFTAFADVHTPRFRAAVGLVHALAHVAAAVGTIAVTNATTKYALQGAGGSGWGPSGTGNSNATSWLDRGDVAHYLLGFLTAFATGFFSGSLLMGTYLLIAINVFGAHVTESFSSFYCQDYKNFLRLHIDDSGTLTIYPIGIAKVPRKWIDTASCRVQSGRVAPHADSAAQAKLPRLEPEGGWGQLNWQLIEEPITLEGPGVQR